MWPPEPAPPGLPELRTLLADPMIDEIMVAPGAVWIERDGTLERTALRPDPERVTGLIEQIVGPAGLRVDRASPMVDVRLPDGSRVNIVVPPLAIDGPCITIRCFRDEPFDLHDFGPAGVAPLLRDAVERRSTILISGATGSGKTSLLGALLALVDAGERIVTIEETAELPRSHGHMIRLQARPANAEGIGEVNLRQLVRNALRMRPDRIVVGEVRGPEVVDLFDAMSTGHAGSLSTCHADSSRHALRRLESLVLRAGVVDASARDLLRASIDLVVHCERSEGGARRVASVLEVGRDADWSSGRGCVERLR